MRTSEYRVQNGGRSLFVFPSYGERRAFYNDPRRVFTKPGTSERICRGPVALANELVPAGEIASTSTGSGIGRIFLERYRRSYERRRLAVRDAEEVASEVVAKLVENLARYDSKKKADSAPG